MPCATRSVSFFGVRQFALVDMPDSAAAFVQRVGRAVRFNGHAGLPPEKGNVRVRLYCATLPAISNADDDDDDGARKSADERQKERLAADLTIYENTLKKL